MNDPKRRRELSGLLAEQRQELSSRDDVSRRMRELAESGSRYPVNPKRARRPALITAIFAGTAVLAMLVCGITAVVLIANGVWFQGQLDSPSVTAQEFYGKLHQEDFVAAYAFFSDGAKSRTSQDAFIQQFQGFDQVSGIVESYPIARSDVRGSSATVVAHVIRTSNTQAQEEILSFVKQSDGWRIDRIAFNGPVPEPTPTT